MLYLIVIVTCIAIALSFVAYLLWRRHSTACLWYLDLVALVSAAIALPRVVFSTWKDPFNVRYLNPPITFGTRLMGWTHSFRGIEHLDRNRGIIVCNHQTNLDIIALANMSTVINRPSFVIKKEIWYAFPFGLYMYLSGCTFVNRSDPKSAYRDLEQTFKLSDRFQGTKYVFMAEGTRNFDIIKTRKMLPFRKGAFRLAIKYKLPITPLVHSPHHFYNKEKGYFGKGAVISKFLPTIQTKHLREDDLDNLVQTVQHLMENAFDDFFEELT